MFQRLDPHPTQSRLWRTRARFPVAACGRRSGKSEIAKRKLVKSAIMCEHPDGWYVYAAPTRDQAKRIAWADLKRMLTSTGLVDKILESELTIKLKTSVEVSLVGMDRPERIEGRILDGIVLDEFANMRPDAWEEHVRPSLSTRGREGWALFIGTPEGRNHFWKLYTKALDPVNQPEWEAFTWKSSDILSPKEIELAKASMDPLTFAQEYEASFNTFEGLAYYSFKREVHACKRLSYDPVLDLILCLDFNVNPGVACVIQEIDGETHVIGEVWIAKGSNTKLVAQRLAADWGQHRGRVLLYGDATGGNPGTQASAGSDWDIVRDVLRPVFGQNLKFRVGRSNPHERTRVNAVNARLLTADGVSHMRVCPYKAPKTVEDFECVMVIDGTAGELDKNSDKEHTHLTDALGYYIAAMFPTTKRYTATTFI
jgi:hypothetical protein